MNSKLTICISNHNSSEFVLNTLYCLKKLTKNEYRVIIRDNDSNLKDFLNLEKKIKLYSNVELYRIENFKCRASLAHGTALNDLVSRIDTKYGVILDADCTFLHKNWDEILIKELDSEHPIIGTPNTISIENSYSFSDFPLMYGVLFDANIMKQLKIDFRPKEGKGYRDTGFELKEKFLKNGYKGKLFIDKNTRSYTEGPFKKIICVEYYLKGYNNIFASHFGRGSSLGKSKYLRTRKRKLYLIPIIGTFLLKLKGKKEKKRWINICKTIVNQSR